jgi:hypothetical protein
VSSTDNAALGAYLNDHLAGSVMAVEMLERMIEESRGGPLEGTFTALLREIEGERVVLRELLERLGVRENPVKKAGAWLAEKAGRLKLSDPGRGALDRLELLEALSLGIQGKLKLWRALERVAPGRPALAGIDYRALQQRARDQHDRVEAQRLEAAREAL